jgi:2'-5' RNA ligase
MSAAVGYGHSNGSADNSDQNEPGPKNVEAMRLFLAVNFPARVRARITRFAAPLYGADLPVRWVDRDGIHLTLKFFGQADRAQADAIGLAAEEIASRNRRFDLRFDRLGAFPSARNPRVIWLGVEPTPELRFLRQDIERSMNVIGFERDRQPFRPHVTLGRANPKAEAGAFREFERFARTLVFEAEHPVTHIDVMRSHLDSAGATYEVLRVARLGIRNG